MTKPVRLAREAREELHEAARRYGEVRPELRAEFLAAIDEVMARLVVMEPSRRERQLERQFRIWLGRAAVPTVTSSDHR